MDKQRISRWLPTFSQGLAQAYALIRTEAAYRLSVVGLLAAILVAQMQMLHGMLHGRGVVVNSTSPLRVEVRNTLLDPVRVEVWNARPLPVDVLRGQPLPVEVWNARPLPVKVENIEPLDVEVRNSWPLDVEVQNILPVPVEVENGLPLDVHIVR